jgi:7,8-dihydroneopterin aldolase/epimerase/oxygenase
MSDRVLLSNMRFHGRHGVLDFEREEVQPFEVDVELMLDLRPAGVSDEVERTADYRAAFDIVRTVIEGPSRRLIESLAEEIVSRLLAEYAGVGIEEAVVRVRKPAVALPGKLDSAGVEIRRRADH